MKPFAISVASAALLAAATLGAQAQTEEKKLPNEPGASQSQPMQEGQGAQRERRGNREMQGQPGAERQPSDRQGQRGDDMKRDSAQSKDKDLERKAQDQKPERDRKAQDQKMERDRAADQNRGKMEQQQGANPDRDTNRRAGDQNQGGNRQAGTKIEIKPEQKTVIKQTLVRENIRPQRINVQVRVGERIPHTVVLHAVPEVIVSIHPDYQRYKIVLLDEDTILVIDPVTWEIVDVIEV